MGRRVYILLAVGSLLNITCVHAHEKPQNAAVDAVSGGVGMNARSQLAERAASEHNLKMVFSLNTGNYVSDVHVSVVNSAGRTMLDGTSDGPWFYAKLPPGTYTAEARYGGKTVSQQFTVPARGQHVAYFRWPASVEQQLTASSGINQLLGTDSQQSYR